MAGFSVVLDPQDDDADAPKAAIAAAQFAPPPQVTSAAEAVQLPAFLLPFGLVDAYFIRRSDVLLVTFDNLSSVGEYAPPQPWLQMRAANAGVSILGIMAQRKDWYRNADTPALITALREAGLFNGFRRILFTGASMGGFAALTYAGLVPGASVLAFGPQTSLSKKVAPFEARYPYAAKKWDWKSPAFLDAAAALPAATEVHLVIDPFVPEDRQHALRLQGQNINVISLGHLGHRAIRQLKALGLLQNLIESIAHGTFDAPAFYAAYRARRALVPWQRGLLGMAEKRGHFTLGLRAAKRLAADFPDEGFARRAVKRFRALQTAPVQTAPGQTAQPSPAEPLEHSWIVTVPPPQAPFTGEILHLLQAYVVPEREGDQKLASGVLKADKSYVTLSKAWIRARKGTPAPSLLAGEPVQDLPGTHLFAGHFRGHFGHFLVESTARLWALDHIPGGVDSLLYLPYRGEVGAIERAIEDHGNFFRILGIAAPVRTYGTTLRVERLYVPELGFGWMERYAGSPAYRQYMQARLNAAVPAEGGDLLYVSRAKLNAARGGVLGETVIEENLARLGYEIFHPERHPLEVQIARYKAAKVIVSLDGSALHLAAYVMPPGGRVVIILRRSKANAADYICQYRAFCNITPEVVDVIVNDWVAGDAARVDFRSIGELDFVALFDRLQAMGIVPPGFRPDFPSQPELRALLETYQERRGEPFRALPPNDALRFKDE